MTRMLRWVLPWLAGALLACGCSPQTDKAAQMRAAYYWSTVFRMDSAKLAFLSDHHITKLYIRYFDVVCTREKGPMPNATIAFSDSVPKGIDVVPTVFITNDCMRDDTTQLARRIMKRVLQMNKTNDVGNVHTIQIDCDWTQQTQQRYFDFLRTLRQMAHERQIALSVTIRLHQLSLPEPPADHGVLMMYNTGDHTDLNCERPILDPQATLPYLKNLSSYELPLAAAYPLYSWNIVFRGRRFVGILHSEGELPLMPGDTIVCRQPTMDDIMTAKQQVGKRRSSANSEVILFDLNNANISRFNPDDYEKIFNQ